jgi:hypothetical protein
MHLDLNIVPGLVKNLVQNQISILIPAIRSLGNLATGSDEQTMFLMEDPNLLERFV